MSMPERLDNLPLRQMVTPTGDAALVFARRGLLDWLSRPDRYQIISHGTGGQIMAASERALCDARMVLRQAYGSCIQFGSPIVHTFVDIATETLMVPVIFMRIDAPRRHAANLQELLAARSAKVEELEWQRDRVVLRAELDLARSLGMERQVDLIAGGAAHILSWLLRYEKACAEPWVSGASGAAIGTGAA